MKKLCALFLVCILLFSAFCLMASAEEDPVFVFHVKGVNGKISGEDAYLFTTQDAYDTGNPQWGVTILLEVQENGLLKVQRDGFSGGGSVPSVTIGDGVVALVVHSSSSDMGQISQYPNVEEKLAALEAKEGMYITLDGIDLKAGTGSGTASLYATAPSVIPSDESSEEPSDEPSSEEPASEDPSSDAAETSSEEPASEEPSEAETSSEAPSAPASADSSVAASDVSEESPDGTPVVAIVIIVIAAVVLIAAVVIIVIKRKK